MNQSKGLSYKESGVDINEADETKRLMSSDLKTSNPKVLNSLGAFASLYDLSEAGYKKPVLVTKMEEPGSKQLLAAQHNRLADIGYDLINHLINDLVMTGAKPLAIQDTIICGKLEKDKVLSLVKVMVDACRAQNCELVGGETSEQPRVIPNGSYILSAAAFGIVEKDKIIDGSKIGEGDTVLAVASNGVHTNGYTLIRTLLDSKPGLADEPLEDGTFLDAVLKPHLCYNNALQELFSGNGIHGLAHITGGGVVDNLQRILPETVNAEIDLSSVNVLPVFSKIKEEGQVSDEDMLRTFNLGVGMIVVAPASQIDTIKSVFTDYGHSAYQIGRITGGQGKVVIKNCLSF